MLRSKSARLGLCCCTVLITAGLIAGAATAQTPYELGARVGAELNEGERDYFGLFPRLDRNAPFRFETQYGDSVHVVAEGDSVLLAMSHLRVQSRVTRSTQPHRPERSQPGDLPEGFWCRAMVKIGVARLCRHPATTRISTFASRAQPIYRQLSKIEIEFNFNSSWN